MLANSWAVFGYVGKQLGRHLNLEILYTDQGTLIDAFERSAYGEEQNDSDFSAFVFLRISIVQCYINSL